MSEFARYTRRGSKRPPLSGSHLVVRPARRSDLDALAEIAAEREGEAPGRWRAFFRWLPDQPRTSRRGIVLVATSSRRILGYGKCS